MGYYTPSYDTAYWINTNSINKIVDENARADLLNNIRYQVELWNAIEMAGIGKLVNFHEIGIGSTQKPIDSNGHPVVEISPEQLNPGVHGVFIHSDKILKISYDEKASKQLFATDTIVHELGHALGLYDLESGWAVDDYGTHKTLMSYNRGTQENELYNAIKYPDIQGVAVALRRHVCKDSDFVRYVKDGALYYNICFYCDRIDRRKSAIAGSLPVADSNTCSHDYKEFVSAGTTHWKKCTKCYKVVEEHVHDFKYLNPSSEGHIKQCVCGVIYENHTYTYNSSKVICQFCGYSRSHEHNYQLASLNTANHGKVCICGSKIDVETHNFVMLNKTTDRCGVCSYERAHVHSYFYKPAGIGRHTATCSLCASKKTEQCLAFAGTGKCAKCGQTMSSGIIITSEDDVQEQIAETLRSLAAELQPQIILP